MSKILEAIRLALDAVWSHKLRSILTVLGNIVAVTSIIAVVALIRGMNAKVSDFILSEAGADAFMIERVGIITNEDDAERARRLNPRITVRDADAISRLSSTGVSAVMARVQQSGRVSYRNKELERARIEGVSEDFIRFSNYGAENGRLPTAAEVRRKRPVAVIGWGVADRLFGGKNPSTRPSRSKVSIFESLASARKKEPSSVSPRTSLPSFPWARSRRYLGPAVACRSWSNPTTRVG